MTWYHGFIACAFLLWLGSSPRDRNALRIILLASLASWLVVQLVTHQIHGAWKLVVPGAVEVATIAAILKWSPNRTGYIQSVLLAAAWLAHLLCYVDLKTGGQMPFFYDHYETIIQVVAVGQLAACYDTLHTVAVRMYHAASSLRFGGGWILRDSTLRASVLHGKGDVENQPGR